MDPALATPAQPARRSVVRTGRLVILALQSWDRRQYGVAAAATVGVALLIGLSTVLIPNPVFGREIGVVAWNYPVWLAISVLSGMTVATYVRRASADSPAGGRDLASRAGLIGGVLGWFAVGCPVCNKIALLALGYSGALTWFAPAQPYLGVAALALSGAGLVVRLRGQVSCSVRPSPAQAVATSQAGGHD